jgi:cysteine desulfurase
MTDRCYLDYNATARLRPEARKSVAEGLERITGNPSSLHGEGRAARAALEEARETLATLYGAEPREAVFAASGTEANNHALLAGGEGPLLVSAGEHDSVLAAAPGAERIPLLPSGTVDLDWLADRLKRGPKPSLISVMWVNNETGVVNPLAEVAALAKSSGILLHSDAVQAAGKLPVDFAACGADLLTFSAHKVGAPAGSGLVLVREGVELPSLIRGGGQERRRRAGTESVLCALAYAAAAKAAEATREATHARLAAWRESFEAALLEAEPEVTIFGRDAERIANTTCFSWAGARSETQLMALDLAGYAVSAGAACSSGKITASHVLLAMGAAPDEAGGALRLSLGWDSREEDLPGFLEAWCRFRDRQRSGGLKTA